jgi:hypothetical protein
MEGLEAWQKGLKSFLRKHSHFEIQQNQEIILIDSYFTARKIETKGMSDDDVTDLDLPPISDLFNLTT